MRATLTNTIFFILMLMSQASFAWQNTCVDGNCGATLASACNPYETYCQCSDPICNKPMYSDCMSRAYCCEAFGNIGAR